MKVVVDSTSLIALARIGRVDILKFLFGEIYICEAVYNEVVTSGRGRPGAEDVKNAEWIKRRKPKNEVAVRALQRDLDLGEAETIILAKEMDVDYVVLDDKEGAQSARFLGLPVIGTIGLITWAESVGAITNFKQTIDELRKKGFRISDGLYDKILGGSVR